MKKLFIIIILLSFVAMLKAQVNITKVNIKDIYLEFSGESVILSGLNSPIIGQLFYSTDKKYLMTENSKEFTTDKSIKVVRPIIRIFKTSENYPQKLKLSIKLYISEIKNGEEKRIFLDTQFDSYIKDQVITKAIKTSSNEEYVIFDDGLSSRILTISLDNKNAFASYLDKIRDMPEIRLDIKAIRLTIENGKRIL